MNYAQQMRHPNWQKKRLEVLELNQFECQNCGVKDEELHVHHPFYKRGAMIWQYKATELQCLCYACHKNTHALDERLKQALAVAGDTAKWQALGVADAVTLWHHDDRPEDERLIKIENHEYALGVAGVFTISLAVLFTNLSEEGTISCSTLVRLRSEYGDIHE